MEGCGTESQVGWSTDTNCIITSHQLPCRRMAPTIQGMGQEVMDDLGPLSVLPPKITTVREFLKMGQWNNRYEQKTQV